MWPISTTPSLTDMMGSDLWILIITRVKVLKHRLGCWLAAQRGEISSENGHLHFPPTFTAIPSPIFSCASISRLYPSESVGR